ncbi:hypothetical protein TNCV_2634771 [Trichonephila clavipes]|nr:hypothetical protein TNCV_2634771 [Trichonephila clavipes]
MRSTVKFYEWKQGQNDPEKKAPLPRKQREPCVNLTSELILLASCAHADKTKSDDKKVDRDFKQNRWGSGIDALKPLRYQVRGIYDALLAVCNNSEIDNSIKASGLLRSDTAFNEMLCDARELANETDIPANFELPKPLHRVRVSEY